ncbi:hypothetical protein CBLAS_1411 [Campylobacter blaseri]|uniref:Uncharacterized protein n=1 Tax=Campylobacter blaseri TaxID=2042961 RepID=A0A2P8QYE0_9BACT|nr:hypothetical protein [Campylobacter blaseri]PSM51268.1 hypothetical protein CQ405_09125 [Campylobacter blaseri]PSM52412.1 hypothetical protein CRN67_09130 [Campylobacter blaseri]QKF86575.1 hypothetical protein CBLAS_1411 [Campylobacter blaseri]
MTGITIGKEENGGQMEVKNFEGLMFNVSNFYGDLDYFATYATITKEEKKEFLKSLTPKQKREIIEYIIDDHCKIDKIDKNEMKSIELTEIAVRAEDINFAMYLANEHNPKKAEFYYKEYEQIGIDYGQHIILSNEKFIDEDSKQKTIENKEIFVKENLIERAISSTKAKKITNERLYEPTKKELNKDGSVNVEWLEKSFYEKIDKDYILDLSILRNEYKKMDREAKVYDKLKEYFQKNKKRDIQDIDKDINKERFKFNYPKMYEKLEKEMKKEKSKGQER